MVRIFFTAITAAVAVAAVFRPWTLCLAAAFGLGLLVDRRVQHLRKLDRAFGMRDVVFDAWVSAGAISAALFSALAVAAAISHWGWSQEPPPSVATQIDSIVSTAARSHLYPVILREVDMHGSGQGSYVVVLRQRFPEHVPPVGASDDFRIYDRVGNSLHLMFEFNPEPRQGLPDNCWTSETSGGGCITLPAGIHHQPGYQFSLKTVRDIWRTAGPAILGDWSQEIVVRVPETTDFSAFLPMPVAVYWSPADGKYKISALITNPWTQGRKLHGAGSYKRAHVLRDAKSSIAIRGYVVDDWLIASGPNDASLIAVFGSGYNNSRGRALIGGATPVEGSPPETWRCSLGSRRGVFVRVRAPGGAAGPSLTSVLARAWKSNGKQCNPLSPNRVLNPNG
jgi:hypothetical protein